MTQREAWKFEIELLQRILVQYCDRGKIYFEYVIPRLGKRIDVIVLIDNVVFVLEFKVGEREYPLNAVDQTCDYALDLKNFHETSHNVPVAPILIATAAYSLPIKVVVQSDNLFLPLKCNTENLDKAIKQVLQSAVGKHIDPVCWENGRYSPTPTIVEAATALYAGHTVDEISRSDAGAINLSDTSATVSQIIRTSKANSQKSICFVTGVPGAGKTLVGLNIATQQIDKDSELNSVFLSGNGPLVAILREALARDKVRVEKERGNKLKKNAAMSEVKAFIKKRSPLSRRMPRRFHEATDRACCTIR